MILQTNKIKTMTIKIRGIRLFAFLLSCMTLFSCTSYKKILYLQGGENEMEAIYKMDVMNANIRLQPQDILTITVNSPLEPHSSSIFNRPIVQNNTNVLSPNNSIEGGDYLVDDDGNIEFPILGKLKVAGLTRKELQSTLKQQLKPYIKEEPIITVEYTNHQISVFGEVNRPGPITLKKDKVNLLEVISLAGDLTMHGKRNDIMLLRQAELPDDEIKIVYLDISSKDILSSPYFYVQPNDIIYVQPSRSRARVLDRDAIGFWFSMWSMTMSALTVLLVLFR